MDTSFSWQGTCFLYGIPVSLYGIPVFLDRRPVSIYGIPVSLYRIPSSLYWIPVSLDRIPISLDKIPASLDRISVSLDRIADFRDWNHHGAYWLMIRHSGVFQGVSRVENVFVLGPTLNSLLEKTSKFYHSSSKHCLNLDVKTQCAFQFKKAFIIIHHSESSLSNTVSVFLFQTLHPCNIENTSLNSFSMLLTDWR